MLGNEVARILGDCLNCGRPLKVFEIHVPKGNGICIIINREANPSFNEEEEGKKA